MNILMNTYEPALTDGNWKTSMASSPWMLWLDEKLRNDGMNLVNVSVGEVDDREQFFDTWTTNPDNVDLIFLYWRWKFPDVEKYARRNKAYERQNVLLQYAAENRIPVYIMNGDLEGDSTTEAGDFLYRAGCPFEIGVPCLRPWAGHRVMYFPNQISYDDIQYVPIADRVPGFTYVGNNYNRYDQMKQILRRHRGRIFGNWIGTPGTENLFSDFPTIEFLGRSDQKDLIDILSHSMYTIHFGKPSYMRNCFISQRWSEAAMAGIINYELPSYTFVDARPSLECFNIARVPTSDDEYQTILEMQIDEMRELSSTYEQWADKFYRLAYFPYR